MRTSLLFPMVLLLAACGSLQETAQVRDDVYDIPDRTAVASVKPMATPDPEPEISNDDYYDPNEAKQADRSNYWDQTYNDPNWYNRGRFGFGYGMNSWGGSGLSLGYSSGWGNTWFNGPGGMYNPYWGNTWQSGYGAWGSPYGYYNPWNGGIYDPWGWNYGGGFGYNPFAYSWGPSWYGDPYCCGWGGGWGGGGFWPISDGGTRHIVAHRPAMSGGGGSGGGLNVTPRAAREISLMPRPTTRPARQDRTTLDRTARPTTKPTETWQQPARKDRVERERVRETRPTRDRVVVPRQDHDGGRSRDTGGGGRSTPSPSPSPRPRR